MRHRLTGFLCVFAGLATVNAGPLTPPPGPVAATHKTLTELEPRIAVTSANTPGDADSVFKITQPGSYYLVGNITGASGKHGIEIVASGVTLDLNGFDLLGVAGSQDGVSATASNLRNIAILNGSLRSWGGDGIDLGNVVVTAARVTNVHAAGNDVGIRVGTDSTITGCVCTANVSHGFASLNACTFTQCVSNDNGTGASAGTGFAVSSGCSLFYCIADGNGTGSGGGSGITTGETSTVQGCKVNRNGAGSTTENDGIRTGPGCNVINCLATLNTGDGIQTGAECLILGNNSITNGFGSTPDGAGIHTTGSKSRIEGNNCTGSDRGIDVDGTGNIIIRNSCSNNTSNWEVAANNKCLVVLGVNAGVISGSAGGVSPGSTDPNANYSY